jgi:ATP-dependent protease Clp ATPase subunit
MIKFRRLRCSFCGKNEEEVSKLVAGPRVYICDGCVAIAGRMMNEPSDDNQPPVVQPSAWRKLFTRARRFSLIFVVVKGD